jgi:hypothetical protein
VFQRFGIAWIPLERNSFGWERSRSCTTCCTSSNFYRTFKVSIWLSLVLYTRKRKFLTHMLQWFWNFKGCMKLPNRALGVYCVLCTFAVHIIKLLKKTGVKFLAIFPYVNCIDFLCFKPCLVFYAQLHVVWGNAINVLIATFRCAVSIAINFYVNKLMHSAHLRSFIYLVASVYVVTAEKEHVNFHSDTTRALNNLLCDRWEGGGGTYLYCESIGSRKRLLWCQWDTQNFTPVPLPVHKTFSLRPVGHVKVYSKTTGERISLFWDHGARTSLICDDGARRIAFLGHWST